MKSFFATLLVLGAATASADMIKMANLDLACKEIGVEQGQRFSITSGPSGSEVVFNGSSYKDRQLTGGTEGGDPYLQAVNNAGGYNITISGGDFKKAFDGSPVQSGRAKALVNDFGTGYVYDAICVGNYEFTPMPSALPPGARP